MMISPLFPEARTIELDAVDSTNNYAKELVANSPPAEGTVVITPHQTAGRGQRGKQWQSERGKSLTCSFILYPAFLEPPQQFYLNMCISLAVKDFCESVLKDDVKIKWPNDIYYRNHKLGGILIENTISGSTIASSVVGIGLNINQEEFAEGIPNPVSLLQIRQPAKENGEERYDIRIILRDLGVFLEKYYLQLRQMHFNFLERAYTDSLYRYQQTHEFRKDDKVFKGEINGVAKDGKLVIHSGGKELRFAFNEVEYVI